MSSYEFIITQCRKCDEIFVRDKGYDRWFRDPNTWKRITHCPKCGVELSAEVVDEIEVQGEIA